MVPAWWTFLIQILWITTVTLATLIPIFPYCLLYCNTVIYNNGKKRCTPCVPNYLSVSKKVFSQNWMTCFPIDQIKSFFNSNHMDGKKHFQLAKIPNFSQFQHTMTKIIIHLDAKIWRLDVITSDQIWVNCHFGQPLPYSFFTIFISYLLCSSPKS